VLAGLGAALLALALPAPRAVLDRDRPVGRRGSPPRARRASRSRSRSRWGDAARARPAA
jgi:hypothetical protein